MFSDDHLEGIDYMKNKYIVIVLLSIFSLNMVSTLSIEASPEEEITNKFDELLDYETISIIGTAEFHLKAQEEGWSGDGSSSNPYLISGLISMQYIDIRNSDLFFHINDCFLAGIRLVNTSNSVISNNNVFHGIYNGIWLDSSKNISILNNNIVGSGMSRSGCIVWDEYSCLISNSPGTTLEKNNISNTLVAFKLIYSGSSTLTGNFIINAGSGIIFTSSPFCTVTENHFLQGSLFGSFMNSSDSHVMDPFSLIAISNSDQCTISGNWYNEIQFDGRVPPNNLSQSHVILFPVFLAAWITLIVMVLISMILFYSRGKIIGNTIDWEQEIENFVNRRRFKLVIGFVGFFWLLPVILLNDLLVVGYSTVDRDAVDLIPVIMPFLVHVTALLSVSALSLALLRMISKIPLKSLIIIIVDPFSIKELLLLSGIVLLMVVHLLMVMAINLPAEPVQIYSLQSTIIIIYRLDLFNWIFPVFLYPLILLSVLLVISWRKSVKTPALLTTGLAILFSILMISVSLFYGLSKEPNLFLYHIYYYMTISVIYLFVFCILPSLLMEKAVLWLKSRRIWKSIEHSWLVTADSPPETRKILKYKIISKVLYTPGLVVLMTFFIGITSVLIYYVFLWTGIFSRNLFFSSVPELNRELQEQLPFFTAAIIEFFFSFVDNNIPFLLITIMIFSTIVWWSVPLGLVVDYLVARKMKSTVKKTVPGEENY
jgi:parallel beta-helix repeat protein